MVSREPVSASSSENSQMDIERLLEELQAQREELELQNKELRLAQIELERARNEHAEFYQLAPIGYLTLDSSLHIKEGNQAIARLFNIDIEHLINSHIMRFIPLESQIHFLEHIEGASREGSHAIDLRLGRSSSQTFIGHIVTYIASNGACQKYRMVVEDITERKRAKEELESANALLNKIVASSLEGILVLDGKELRVKAINDFYKQNFLDESYKHKDVVGKRIEEFIPGVTKTPVPNLLKNVAKTGVPFIADEYEFRGFERGTTYWNLAYIPIGSEDNRDILVTAVEVTTQVEATQALEEYSNELKRSNEELQQFAYVASHDLKSPLSTISSYLQLLQLRYQGKVLDQHAAELIDHAVDGASHMAQFIDDLLRYSSIEQSEKKLEEVDMNLVLDQVKKNLNASIVDSNAVISSEHLPIVMADDSQLIQLLQNLISNAIKFHGQEAPQIHVSAQKKWEEWVFSIKDNGIGIPKDQQERIFQMFQRLRTREEYEGTGIGLALCKKIVEHHGGRIWVESEEGEGSTFFFTIPKRN